MTDRLLALLRAEGACWRSLRKGIRVPWRDGIGIQPPSRVAQLLRNGEWKLFQPSRHRVSPGSLSELPMERREHLFGCLLGGEAGPFVPTVLRRQLGECEVEGCLREPVSCSARHPVPAAGSSARPISGAYHPSSHQKPLLDAISTEDPL